MPTLLINEYLSPNLTFVGIRGIVNLWELMGLNKENYEYLDFKNYEIFK